MLVCALFFILHLLTFTASSGTTKRNLTQHEYGFAIDYENSTFLLDGKPFRYVSGSFHYFRCPREYWRDRLQKLRAAGLNAVSTYVEWSLHQLEPDVWNWQGDADIVEFIKIAREEDLLVLLRPGPYICAERDMGGLPYWLLSENPSIKLRENDEMYLRYVRNYLHQLFIRVGPFLRGNGGPIIMVQVENEYGSFRACDKEYLTKLRDMLIPYVEEKALLYTTDGYSDRMLRCGSIPEVYATVDFGTDTNPSDAFKMMRLYEPKGPLVNSEFYPGWLTHWEEPLQTVASLPVTRRLDEMLRLGASVNFYMFYGGTNFGFTAGANGNEKQFQPQLTSYDYDAPISEAGDLTDKYYRIKDVISKYLPIPEISFPKNSSKGNYGKVDLEPILGLFHPLGRELFGTSTKTYKEPPTFEALKLKSYLVLYETKLPEKKPSPSLLGAVVADRAIVYTDFQMSGILSRTQQIFSMPIYHPYAKSLEILLENQGHLNYGPLVADFKGISDAKLNGKPLESWNVTGFRLENVDALKNVSAMNTELDGPLYKGPVFLRGSFSILGEPEDTFLDTSRWGKGVAYVNGHNLGRYWASAGPQLTLYVPATFLKSGANEIVVLELELLPIGNHMTMTDTPMYSSVSLKTA